MYKFNLRYGQPVTMHLVINGELSEVAKLEYCGVIGEDWLWFQNKQTLENHLVKEDQFPSHSFKMGRENDCRIVYS